MGLYRDLAGKRVVITGGASGIGKCQCSDRVHGSGPYRRVSVGPSPLLPTRLLYIRRLYSSFCSLNKQARPFSTRFTNAQRAET